MRETEIKKLRPEIPAVESGLSVSTAEQFQNETLRPILKYQNALLLAIFRDHIHRRKGLFYELNQEKKRAYIDNALKKDMRLRNLMMGAVAGHFTLVEWGRFEKNNAELIRRTMTMMAARLQNQLDDL